MQAPKYAQPGQAAKELNLILELKCIADVGLVGFPNVGKSTFLSRVSNAKPKIADYHFTTLNPNLGVVSLDGGKGFVIADIPGLIEGAAEGIGLGIQFLKHIERCKVLLHLVDAAGVEGRDPVEDIRTINQELSKYNDILSKKRQVIAANKMDLIFEEDERKAVLQRLEAIDPEIRVFPVSAATGEGTKELLYYLKEMVKSVGDGDSVFESEFDVTDYYSKTIEPACQAGFCFVRSDL